MVQNKMGIEHFFKKCTSQHLLGKIRDYELILTAIF